MKDILHNYTNAQTRAIQKINKRDDDKNVKVLTSHNKLSDSDKKTRFWLEEFAAPYYVFKDAGVEITLASPQGGQPPLDLKSEEPDAQTEVRVIGFLPTILNFCNPTYIVATKHLCLSSFLHNVGELAFDEPDSYGWEQHPLK